MRGIATEVLRDQTRPIGELGAELHDRVISGISALILEMEHFKREQYNRASVQTAVTHFQASMRVALAELREVVNGLQGGPAAGLDRGLVEALRTGPLAELRLKTGAATKITASPRWPRNLDSFLQAQLYRIAEQALRNAGQHSGASSVSVSLRTAAGCLVLEVSDDGRGLGWEAPVPGQGLTGMQQRSLLIGGELEFHSRPGGGTVVQLRVPMGARSLSEVAPSKT